MQAGTLIALTVPVAVGVAVFAFLILRKWIPSLRLVGSPVEQAALRRAENAETELTRANAEIAKLEQTNAALEKERSLERTNALIHEVAVGVKEMLTKLAEMNGGMRHAADALKTTNENLETSTRAIELLASQIIIDIQKGPQP